MLQFRRSQPRLRAMAHDDALAVQRLALPHGARHPRAHQCGVEQACRSDKSEGEEKCRLFGKWGGVRYVVTPFSFVRARILRKRKAWLAAEMGVECYDQFKVVLGSHWWHHLGHVLLEVIMPIEYYQVPRDGILVLDDIGTKAYEADLARFPGSSVEEAMLHSAYRVFWEVGKLLYKGDEGQVRDYALHKISQRHPVVPVVDPQLVFKFGSGPKEG